MKVAQLSHKGVIRPINEDSIYVSNKKDLFIIADGMGGHNAGEVASNTAVNKVRYFIRSKISKYDSSKTGYFQLLGDAINYANEYIFNIAKKDNSLEGMGTTIITAIIDNSILYIGHVGDSRAYLINTKGMKQITSDHSLVQELLNTGTITQEEAQNYPHKNIITRALGCKSKIKVDTYVIKLKEKDGILLCTDGLTNMLSDSEILNIIKNYEPKQAVKSLIEAANLAGGNDNISTILICNDN